MSTVAQQRDTPEEYLALERKAESRSEYVNGHIYAMVGASREHNLIAGNVFARLHGRLRTRPCEVDTSEMRVKVSPTGIYTYPEVVALCGEPRFDDDHVDTLLNPTVILEVFSSSTEAYDRGETFAHYLRLETLIEGVFVAQDKARVEHYQREGDRWVSTEIGGLASVLTLPPLERELPLREIHERVQLEPSARDA